VNRVHVYDIDRKRSVRITRIQKILKFAMKKLELDQHEVHVTLLKDTSIQELNLQYRKKNYVPDVLSFEQGEMIDGFFFLGDVLISPKKAQLQAKENRHRVKDELAILSLHGLLHLLGYDHMTKREEKVMFTLQDKLYEHTKDY